MKLGESVILNGNISKIEIIVAKRKDTAEVRKFAYDYMSMDNYLFWMINNEFREAMIGEIVETDSIKMPEQFNNYNTPEQIKEAYQSLQKSFRNKDKSLEFDFIDEENFSAIVSKIVNNTFNVKEKQTA